ncbi:MAG: hypothetical protein JO362_14310, partial [Streptomycetaceae bacterium]|nr:hypothetical protein [Streptomycetaceae bacterium]
MSVGRHFGMVISRMPRVTYAATILASQDCRFLCSACYSNCWGIYRLHGETAWLCSRCADMKGNGLEPGPRLFNTQPPRRLRVGEQLRSPEGAWSVTSSKRVETREDGTLQQACMYVLTRDDGHEEEWRGRDMADFHLVPAAFEHITRARCTELGIALTSAGLPWEDNGRQATPQRLRYTATDPLGRQWSI